MTSLSLSFKSYYSTQGFSFTTFYYDQLFSVAIIFARTRLSCFRARDNNSVSPENIGHSNTVLRQVLPLMYLHSHEKIYYLLRFSTIWRYSNRCIFYLIVFYQTTGFVLLGLHRLVKVLFKLYSWPVTIDCYHYYSSYFLSMRLSLIL